MIIFFSGTGNSERVARRLSALLDDTNTVRLEGDMLLNPGGADLDADESGRIIWVFPTYSWGVPPAVARFISECAIKPAAKQARHFMVTTCGDDMADTDRQWRRLLLRRGLDARGAFAVIMPNTYVLMKGFDTDAPGLAKAKLDASEERVREIARAIASDAPSSLIRGSFAWIKSHVIYPWFIRHAMSPKPFHADGGCIGCGICVKGCPMDNITMENGMPVWGEKCAMCLRCYHYCPRHAVAYGNKTDGKGQWQCPKIDFS